MPLPDDFDYNYDRAISLFKAGRLEEAIAALKALQAAGNASPEVKELLEDAQLKLRMADAKVVAKEAPQPSLLSRYKLPLIIVLLLALLGVGGVVLLGPGADQQAAQGDGATPTSAPPQPTTPAATSTAPPGTTPSATPESQGSPTPLPQGNGTLQITFAASQGGQGGQGELVRTPKNIELIVDASGTMDGFVEGDQGQKKIEMARAAVASVISVLPDDTRIALRTYGTRRSNDCTDLQLVKPLDLHAKQDLISSLEQIRPITLGRTPIGASIDAAREDLATAEGSTVLIIVSDGEENCDNDPIEAAQRLKQALPELVIHVIGFDIGPEEWVARLRTIAEVGGGTYFDVRNSAQLNAAFQEAIQLKFEVFDQWGNLVANNNVGGEPVQLPAGTYRVWLSSDQNVVALIEVKPDQLTTLQLQSNGESFSLTPTQ